MIPSDAVLIPKETLAISLYQPWATLVVVGAKRIETRSRRTHHRGQLGIHATQSCPDWAREFADLPEVQQAVRDACPSLEDEWGELFPTGALLGTADVTDCLSTNQHVITSRAGLGAHGWLPPQSGTFERMVGDYSADRWMWLLANPQRLAAPVRARGGQFLWRTREGV